MNVLEISSKEILANRKNCDSSKKARVDTSLPLKERQKSSKAGQRRLSSETFFQPNVLSAKMANANSDLADALIKYGNYRQNLNPINAALEANDYKAALVLLNYLGESSDIKEGYWFPLDRLLQKIRGPISADQEQLIKSMTLMKFQTAMGISPKTYALSVAAHYGNIDLIDWVISQGADLNDHYGYPLSGAIASGRKLFVEHLISKGADINKVKGALNTAVFSGNLELVKFLWEEKKQKPYAPWGNPLSVAIIYKHDDVLRYLLEFGMNPNEPSKVLPEALSLSETTKSEKEHKKEIIELLLNYGARV